jgi:hypothetical protein
MPIAPCSLDSTALAARLRELARDTRNVDVDFILHLDEFDRRRAYLDAGFGSLWVYCLEALHLREGSAGRRIQAMRVLRRFPSLEGALRDGRLSLSTIALLGQVLTPENLEDLLARAAFKTRADVDHLVASIQPRPAPKDGIRKLPERRVDADISSFPLASLAGAPSTAIAPAAPSVPPSPAPFVEAVPLREPDSLPAPPVQRRGAAGARGSSSSITCRSRRSAGRRPSTS